MSNLDNKNVTKSTLWWAFHVQFNTHKKNTRQCTHKVEMRLTTRYVIIKLYDHNAKYFATVATRLLQPSASLLPNVCAAHYLKVYMHGLLVKYTKVTKTITSTNIQLKHYINLMNILIENQNTEKKISNQIKLIQIQLSTLLKIATVTNYVKQIRAFKKK